MILKEAHYILSLTCDLEVTSPASHTALTADCSAPIFSRVLLLLALLGPQEEQAIVGQ